MLNNLHFSSYLLLLAIDKIHLINEWDKAF